MATRCGLRPNKEPRPFAEWPGDAGGYFSLSRILRKLLFCFDWGSYHIASTGHSANALGTLLLREAATRPGVLAGALTE